MTARPLLLTALAAFTLLGSGCGMLRPKAKAPGSGESKPSLETTGKLRERATKPASPVSPAAARVTPSVSPAVAANPMPSTLPIAPVTNSGTRASYPLRANDPIIIFLRGLPGGRDQQLENIIDGQGTVSLPYLGRMQAAGKTTAQFEQEIEERYIKGEIYRSITVNVVMPQQFIFVDGEVKAPARYQLVAGMTLLQAISSAGGTGDFANPEKVQLIRGGSNTIFNIRDLRKTPEKDPPLEAGDRIFVPESRI